MLFCSSVTLLEQNEMNVDIVTIYEIQLEFKMNLKLSLKLPSRDESWMGDYATCGSCHLEHIAQFALAPRLLQRYDQ